MNRRREFLKSTGLAGLGLFGAGSVLAGELNTLPLEANYGASRVLSTCVALPRRRLRPFG
jgi:hypothetical protein